MRKLVMLVSILCLSFGGFAQHGILNAKVSDLSFYKLPYSYNSLVPVIDSLTVSLHYGKHHKGYFEKFIKEAEILGVGNETLQSIFSKVSSYPVGIRNNAGGFYNHVIYWEVLQPKGKDNISPVLENAVIRDFGSMENLKKQLYETSVKLFGSGWAWLSVNPEGKLFVSSTPNQDNPLMDLAEQRGFPILGIDVWEHAYYLGYQNKRAEYVTKVLNALNWQVISEFYDQANMKKAQH